MNKEDRTKRLEEFCQIEIDKYSHRYKVETSNLRKRDIDKGVNTFIRMMTPDLPNCENKLWRYYERQRGK
jgi:hypothetical protein